MKLEVASTTLPKPEEARREFGSRLTENKVLNKTSMEKASEKVEVSRGTAPKSKEPGSKSNASKKKPEREPKALEVSKNAVPKTKVPERKIPHIYRLLGYTTDLPLPGG